MTLVPFGWWRLTLYLKKKKTMVRKSTYIHPGKLTWLAGKWTRIEMYGPYWKWGSSSNRYVRNYQRVSKIGPLGLPGWRCCFVAIWHPDSRWLRIHGGCSVRNLESNIHLQVSGVHGSERPFRGIQGATKTLPETNKFEKLPNLKRKLIIDSDFTDFSGETRC